MVAPCFDLKAINHDDLVFFFFFQAEDGIRDYKVTGVQTGALPISLPVEAFGEGGGPLQNPGPLIRVVAGTVIDASVRNAIPAETLVVHGLGTRPGNDSLIVLPGETRSVHFTAGAPGTYFYWGATT